MRSLVALGFALLLVPAGCGDSEYEQGPAPTTVPTEEAQLCTDASGAAATIAEGLTVPGLVLIDAVAVAEDAVGYYFVAGELDGDGWEQRGDVAVWATDGLAGGDVYAVSAAAKEFSSFADAAGVDAALTMEHPAALQAELCAELETIG